MRKRSVLEENEVFFGFVFLLLLSGMAICFIAIVIEFFCGCELL